MGLGGNAARHCRACTTLCAVMLDPQEQHQQCCAHFENCLYWRRDIPHARMLAWRREPVRREGEHRQVLKAGLCRWPQANVLTCVPSVPDVANAGWVGICGRACSMVAAEEA